MKERIPKAFVGQALTAQYLNRLRRGLQRKVVGSAASNTVGVSASYEAYMAQRKRRMRVVKVIKDNNDGTYEVQYRYYDGSGAVWRDDTTSNIFTMDAGAVGLTFAVGDLVVVYWDTQRSMFIPVAGGVPAQVEWAKTIGSWWHGISSEFIQAHPVSNYRGDDEDTETVLNVLLPVGRGFYGPTVTAGVTQLYPMPFLGKDQIIPYVRGEDGKLICVGDYLGPPKYTVEMSVAPQNFPPVGFALMDGAANARPRGSGCSIFDNPAMQLATRRFPRMRDFSLLDTQNWGGAPGFYGCDLGVGIIEHTHPICFSVSQVKITDDVICIDNNPTPAGFPCVDFQGLAYSADIPLIDPERTGGFQPDYRIPEQEPEPPQEPLTLEQLALNSCGDAATESVGQPDFIPPWFGVWFYERIDNSENPGFHPGRQADIDALPDDAP